MKKQVVSFFLLMFCLPVFACAQRDVTTKSYSINGITYQIYSDYKLKQVTNVSADSHVLFHQKDNHGVFVIVPNSKFDLEQRIENLRIGLMADFLPNESQEFSWKPDKARAEKAGKYDVKQGKQIGFNGESRVLLEFHQIDYQNKSFIVGYYYVMDKGARAKAGFESGLGGGNGAAGAACETIISSVTNEKATDVRVGQPPPPAAPPRKP